MNLNEYQKLALNTLSPHIPPHQRLQMHVLGLCSEAGEVASLVKKTAEHNRKVKEDEIVDELGDEPTGAAIAILVPIVFPTPVGMNLSRHNRSKIAKKFSPHPWG